MMRRSTARLLKVVVALAVTIGMLLSAIHVTTSHNPVVLAQAEAERHAELAMEIAEHGHSHFDGDDAEQLPGHLHGHNSADHIHDAANVFPVHTMRLPSPVRVTLPSFHEGAGPGLRHGLDRPPRGVIA
jgi:uncharacterized protein involved in copper resistance